MNVTFSISNIAGGDLREFHLLRRRRLDGTTRLVFPQNAARHARAIGYGGPSFGGEAAEEAAKLWLELEEEDE